MAYALQLYKTYVHLGFKNMLYAKQLIIGVKCVFIMHSNNMRFRRFSQYYTVTCGKSGHETKYIK